MNDRFRFRCFDKDIQKFIVGFRLCDHYKWPNGIIEQCTGLKDKNGNLIYEGDIVIIPDDWEEYGFLAGEVREVYFEEGGFRLKPKKYRKCRGHWLEDTKDFEVIGNIHENPELLESVTNCNQ